MLYTFQIEVSHKFMEIEVDIKKNSKFSRLNKSEGILKINCVQFFDVNSFDILRTLRKILEGQR